MSILYSLLRIPESAYFIERIPVMLSSDDDERAEVKVPVSVKPSCC